MGAACIAITRIIENVAVLRIAILPGFRIRSVDPRLVGVKWPCVIAGARDALVKEVGAAAVPGSSFFREPVHNLIRFRFAKRPESLEAAGRRLIGLRERAAQAPERV
jgi:hypothetical protein